LIVTLKEYLRKNWWRIALLVAFVILMAIAISRHEPFTDEGQAWLIARDASPWRVMFHFCRYEGHPCAWYLLLMIPAKLHLSYVAMSIISGVIATVSAYLILWYAPFPAYVTALLPFTYFFFYQYGVVARGYVLGALLLLLAAMRYRFRYEHPYQFIAILCVLANVTIPATLISIGILIASSVDLRRRWGDLGRATRNAQKICYLIFAANLAFVILQMWPAADSTTNPVTVVSAGNFWNIFINYFLRGPFTQYWFITLPALIVSLVWFWRRKLLLLYLLPTVFHFVFIAVKPASIFNHGLFFVYWIFVLWVSLVGLDRAFFTDRVNLWLRRLVVIVMLVVICIQISWSVQAFRTDYSKSYSGTYDVAQFIKQNKLEGQKFFMVGQQPPTGVNLFFDRNIFANNNGGGKPAFYVSTKSNKAPATLDSKTLETIERERPGLVVVSLSATPEKTLGQLRNDTEAIGYGVIGPFEANMLWEQRAFVEHTYSFFVLYDKSRFTLGQ